MKKGIMKPSLRIGNAKKPKKAIKVPSVATIKRRYFELRRLREQLMETEMSRNSEMLN